MQMKRKQLLITLALAAPLAFTACGRSANNEPAVATPAFSVDRTRVALGSPVELTYKFSVAPQARIDGDYRVFVHFLDSEGDLMWTDDHTPVPPTPQWKPGQTVTYSHTMFIPVYPYVGETKVRVGLYSPTDGRRLPLSGNEQGDREYEVGTLTLAPQSENIFLIYRDGWNAAESAPDQPAVEWQWTKKSAGVSFRNPKKDVLLLLESDGRPDVFNPPQQVSIRLNDDIVHTFAMTDKSPVVRRIPLSTDQLGAGDMVDMKIEVDKTFVPAKVPAGQPGHSADTRELGIRVYHLFVAPKE
jgi:hypothetical protein